MLAVDLARTIHPPRYFYCGLDNRVWCREDISAGLFTSLSDLQNQMNIFVIGGVTVSRDSTQFMNESALLQRTMQSLGQDIVRRNHNLVVCSPFEGSADLEAVKGAATAGSERSEPFVHFYIPHAPAVRAALCNLERSIPGLRFQEFTSQAPSDLENEEARNHAWLLAQLSALDRCHALIAIGGKSTGPMSLLLPLAESRRRCILPVPFLGGAAAECFERQRHQLQDKLGEKMHLLNGAETIDEVVSLLQHLLTTQVSSPKSHGNRRFFVSYSTARPEEADFVETVLRRRNLIVFRDDRDFGPGRIVQGEIDRYLYQADIFIALWCQEYACSPWCFDELELALKRQEEGRLSIWLLCLDKTRVIPPNARSLINYPAYTRKELEGALLKLLDHGNGRSLQSSGPT